MSINRVISLSYELKDANTKEILESNLSTNPISFITGKNQILPKLEEEVDKLEVGSESTIFIGASDGLGSYDENAVQILPIEQFAGIELKVGMELFGEGENGETARVCVKNIDENSVTVDFNHPYAGKDLEFDVKIVESREASEDEMMTGVVASAHVCGCGSSAQVDDDECCGGKHHENGGGCCGRHHH